jgi:ubiquinone/menaquinone biosynthesis C-methylase UbiE
MSRELNRQRFDQAAAAWDANPMRRELALAISAAMQKRLHLDPAKTMMDYGTGTGLIALALHDQVKQIYAADISPAMLSQLEKKLEAQKVKNIIPLLWDLQSDEDIPVFVDVLVSSMAMHHLDNLEQVSRQFFDLLNPGGWLAIADLDLEAGDFHQDPAGVKHHGFDRNQLKQVFSQAGFERVQIETAHTIERTTRDGKQKSFDIFLMTAEKPLS